ncbi:MAG: DUF1611 domain-containing protein [Candidatus Sumerlaeaceae bacterium]
MSFQRRKIAILAEGKFSVLAAKTAVGVIRYSPHEIVAVVDSQNAGKSVQETLGFGGNIPVVASVADALKLQPEIMLIGIAPTGGRLPDEWRHFIIESIEAHLEVWSGMHAFLTEDEEFAALAERKGVRLWDVRQPAADLNVGMGLCLKSRAYVVLTVGSDCNVGKMTTALELQKFANAQGYKAGFVATGQTGILIEGEGTPLDAVPGDFMAGEVERLVVALDQDGCDVIFVEGQGSIVHPGFGPVTLGLMLGAMPDSYILCHQPSRKTFRPDYDIPIPPLHTVVLQYEQLMEYFKAPKIQAIALNTFDLSPEQAAAEADETERIMGMPTTDPIRYGVAKLWQVLEPLVKQKLGK